MYTWEFTGGVVLEDAGAEAWVAYETEGVYPVTLTVTDANGNSDTWTWEGMIEVVNEPVVPELGLSEDFNGSQFPPANWRMGSTAMRGSMRGTWSKPTTAWPNSRTIGSTRRAFTIC